MKKQIPAWLVLVIIMLAASFLLAGTNMITKDVISEQAVKNQEKARMKVLPEADAFLPVALSGNAALDGLFLGQASNETVGYVGVSTVSGYGGPIEIIVGVDTEGTLHGISVGGSGFAETAGLGAKAKDEAFMSQFVGKKTPVNVIKAGEQSSDNTIDTITAATITSNAITRGVNDVAKYANRFSEESVNIEAGEENPEAVLLFKADGTIEAILIKGEDSKAAFEKAKLLAGKQAPIESDDVADEALKPIMLKANEAFEKLNAAASGFKAGTASASAKGFAGPVAVEVTFNDAAEITEIKIGDDDFAETEGFGAKALDPDFAQKLIGKKAPMELSGIEAISGATITSQAVVDAINEAHKQLSGPSFAGGQTVASAKGFAGLVAVDITFNDAAEITEIKIGDDDFAETEGYGAKALDPDFAQKLIGKKAPMELSDIEAISGATITSEAVVEAINNAYKELASGEAEPEEETPAAEEPKAEEPEAEEPAGEAVKGTGDGYGGDVNVEAVFSEDGEIKSLKIDEEDFMETAGIGTRVLEEESFINSFIGKKAPIKIDDIEAVSGATITSEAVVDAVNDAFEKASAEPAGEAVKGTGDGYGGDVNVEAVFSEDGEIKSLKIDEEDFMETVGIGTRVLEEESFMNSLIGKKAPIKIDDIEAVSGATITSEAVVDAVNDAFEKAGAETKEEPVAEEPKAEEPAGEAVKGTGDGYGGDVNVEAVFAEDGEIKSLKIDEEDFMETAGIGTRVLEEKSFINSFIGKKAPIKIDDIEAVSGATITSEAVVDAVNDAFEKAGAESEAEEPAAETKEEEPETEPAGEAVKGTGDGYGGDVNVEAVFSEDGEIKSLKIDEEDFMETAGIGTRVLEEESFINSFIGKKAPIKIDDIEAVSGATITSEAVVDAVNDAFEKASAEPAAEEPAAEAKEEEPEAEEPAGEAVKGTGDGYGGDVNVEAVFSEDGEIKSLKIDEEDFMETAGIGTRVLEEESFINSFIGKKAPIKIDDIEAVSGATITSEAVVDAVNDAFEKIGSEPEAEEPAAETKEEPAGKAVKGTGDGYGGDVNVEAVFSEDGEIKSLKIDEEDFMETAGIGTRVLEEESFINSFIGKKAPIKIDDIEAVSGATITSEAVVDAVNDAFEKIGSETEAVKGTGDGYGGDVNVEAVFSEDGEIKSLKIDEEDFMETAGIGTRVLEEESFINSFIGKKAPIKIDDIEAVSGATITSEAVVDAVNDAFEKAGAETKKEPVAEEPKAEEPAAQEPAGKAVKGTGDGYGGDVNVEAVFSEDGEIKSLKIDEEDFMETAGIGTRVLEEESFINSFIGKKAPIKIDDIEAVSGATITSEAVVDAVNDAFNNR